jgi:hypothetical protein
MRGQIERDDHTKGAGREKVHQGQQGRRPSRVSHEQHCRRARTIGQSGDAAKAFGIV